MTDPFAALRTELVQAARAPARTRWPWRWAWVRRRSHPAALGVVALMACGSAAAAVFTLNASPSQPLHGQVPGRPIEQRVKVGNSTIVVPLSYNGESYTVAFVPELAAGGAGWSATVAYRGGGGQSGGLGGYLTRSNPILVDSSLAMFGTGRSLGPKGQRVEFALTAGNVAAVRVENRTIRTFTSPALPRGDRGAVFFVPGLTMVSEASPGTPAQGQISLPGPRGRHMKVNTLAVVPLDSAGRALPVNLSPPAGSFTRFWQAPSAITPGNESQPYRGPSRPLPGACELSQHGLAALTPEWGYAENNISPAQDAVGEVFLSCVNTVYFLHHWPFGVAVLLDGRDPGRTLGPLPGAVPVPGHPGTVEIHTAEMSAKRIGNAWLVVQGGGNQAQRLAVLAALGIQKLDLHHIRHMVGPH